MKRKEFIYSASLIMGGALLGCTPKNTKEKNPSVKPMRLDLHAHPGLFFRKGTEAYAGDEAFLQRVEEMNTAGLDAVFFALVADWPLLEITDKGIVPSGAFSDDQGWKAFQAQFSILNELLARSAATTALTAKDLSEGSNVKAYLACEGGDFIGSSIERLDEAYEMGLRSIQLVHYAPNNLGDLQTWAPEHNGLSDLGKSVVQKMNQVGMIIDVAHASMATVKDVVQLTEAPIMLSHSILAEAGSTSPVAARAISVEHAKMIADTGGVIGMWPSGYSTDWAAFVDHTFRMIDAVGIDHVGMGTDMDANFQPIITDYSGFANWEEALLAKGLSTAEVNQLLGGNAQRVLEAVL
jgi:membrane dipeptidase